MVKTDYATKSAEWWISTIRNGTAKNIDNELEKFYSLLTSEIMKSVNRNGVLTISTCNKKSLLLDTVAKQSELPVDVPRGYEMKIIIDTVSVYNNDGSLVCYF